MTKFEIERNKPLWVIEHLYTHDVCKVRGNTFGEACEKIGWNPNDCKVVKYN